MTRRDLQLHSLALEPVRVAYWYFRLNGFHQIENFIVHNEQGGSQRTEADLIGVRLRFREEFVFDHPNPMVDDERLLLSPKFDDVIVVEVKKNQPCKLNGPWTKRKDRNVNRVLAAIGCLERSEIKTAAEHIYDHGIAIFGNTRIRLVAIGRDRNPELEESHREVLQLIWDDVLGFIWDRLDRYHKQKKDVPQWDDCGRDLNKLSESCNRGIFLMRVKAAMGIG